VLLQVQVMYHCICRLCTTISSGYVPLYLQVMYHYIFRLCTTISSGYVPMYLQVMYHYIFRLFTTISSGCVAAIAGYVPVPLYLQVVYHYIFRLCTTLSSGCVPLYLQVVLLQVQVHQLQGELASVRHEVDFTRQVVRCQERELLHNERSGCHFKTSTMFL